MGGILKSRQADELYVHVTNVVVGYNLNGVGTVG
jgi:hypothetical protein